MASPNETEQLQVLEAVDAGQVPDRAMLERNFSEDEQLQILEHLDSRKGVNTAALPPKMEPNLGAGFLMGRAGLDAPLSRESAPGETARRAEGVETRKPLTAGRFEASTAIDPEDEIKALKASNPDVRFRRVGERAEYLDPTTSRWTDVSGFGGQLSDIREAPAALPAIGAAIGGLPALAGPAGIPLAALGTSVGAVAGDLARTGMGRAMGVNPPDAEYIASASQEGLTEGTMALVGGGVMRAFHRILGGARIDPREAQLLLDQGKDAEDIINQLRARGYDIKATPAQLSGDMKLLNEELTARQGLISPGIERDLAERQATTDAEVTRFFNDTLGSRGMLRSPTEVGAQIQQQAETVKRLTVDNPTAAAQKLRERLEARITAADSLNEPLAGKEIKGGLQRLAGEVENAEDAAWAKTRELAGVNVETATSKVSIPVDDALQTKLNGLIAEADTAMFEGQAAGIRAALPKFVNGSMDFQQLQKGLSYVRAAQRRVYRATDPNLPQGANLTTVEKALEGARDRALAKAHPELLVAVKEAEALTTKKYATYRRGLVGDILREGDGAMPNGRVFRELFRPNNGEAAAEVAQVLSGDAKAMSAARKSIMSLYRQEVMPDGKVTGKAHRAFMEKYADTIDPFLNQLERKQIRSSGNLLETLENTEIRLANKAQAFTKTLEGRLERMNSEAITKAIFNNNANKGGSAFSLGDAAEFAKMFKGTPMEERVRESVRDEISRRVLKDGKLVDPGKLTKLLEQTGEDAYPAEGKLRAIMGDQYIDDLKAVTSALQITGRKGTDVMLRTPDTQTLWGLYRQIVWPPLSHSGAVVRRVQNLALESQRRAVASIISDPDKLRQIVKYGHLPANTEKAAAILASVGAALPETE